MIRRIVFIVGVFSTTLADFFNVETSLEPDVINQNQVFINRKERFIKFDTKDNELEIELGISIPFIKVPLTTNKNVWDGKSESKISVNAPGLLVAGMLMLTSFVVVPLLFTTTPDSGFGFQRKEKRDVWSMMENFKDSLSSNAISSSPCIQKSICWIANVSRNSKDGSIGKWIYYILRTSWIKHLISGTMIGEAVDAADEVSTCDAKYSHCSLTFNHLLSLAKTIGASVR